jgi:hypothetical protein
LPSWKGNFMYSVGNLWKLVIYQKAFYWKQVISISVY